MDALGEVGPLADATRLTTDAPDPDADDITDSHVTWSPDGSRIAFLSRGRGNLGPDSCDLWAMDPADRDGDGVGDNLSRLTTDEKQLRRLRGHHSAVVAELEPHRLHQRACGCSTSRWSMPTTHGLNVATEHPEGSRNAQAPVDADGEQVIFRSDTSGEYQMYSLPVPPRSSGLRAASPVPTQVTFDDRNKQQADWGAEEGVPSTAALRVSRDGEGRVTAPKIRCGRDCAGTFVTGKVVKLTATPRRAERVTWTGACSGHHRTCSIRMSQSKSVKAVFRSSD